MTHPIHDLYIKTLQGVQGSGGARLDILRYDDHLLRRFGLAQVVEVDEGQAHSPRVREVADEIWASIRGTVEFSWIDKRPASPTSGAKHQVRCEEPTLVLVPFGVSLTVRAVDGPAQLLRLATHEDPDQ